MSLFHNSDPDDQKQSPGVSSDPEDKTTVFATDDEQEALACSLVLSSVGISHHYSETQYGLALSVANGNAAEADRQLRAYLHENENWPKKTSRHTST